MRSKCPFKHCTEEELERYAMGAAAERERAFIEEHLLLCVQCQQKLTQVDRTIALVRSAADALQHQPVNFVHRTAEGEIRLLVTQSASGGWRALISGQDLEGAKQFTTVQEANEFVLRSFEEMFPEHRCTEACGPPAAKP